MRQGNVKPPPPLTMVARSGDWIWGGMGLGAAGLSASFAAYMMMFGPINPGAPNAGDFGLFARMQRGQRVADSRIAPILAPSSKPPEARPAPPSSTASNSIDFAPTGSVSDKAEAAGLMPPAVKPARRDGPMASYTVREVFDGRALVETPSSLTLVAKGSVIPGAGEVLSIERRGTQWAVVTSRGVIGGR